MHEISTNIFLIIDNLVISKQVIWRFYIWNFLTISLLREKFIFSTPLGQLKLRKRNLSDFEIFYQKFGVTVELELITSTFKGILPAVVYLKWSFNMIFDSTKFEIKWLWQD